MYWRVAGFAALIALAFVVLRFTPVAELMTKEKMIAAFTTLQDAWWAPLLLIALYTLTAPLGFPMTPYVVGSGVVFGFLRGASYNLIGLMLGAATSYFLARSLGREFVVHITRGKLRRVERLFERSGFWPLVQTRFIPMPFAMVNFGAALSGVKATLFLTTTAIGLIPSTFIHTYFVAKIFTNFGDFVPVIQYAVVLGVFNLLISYPSIKRAWQRRRRYQRLTAERREKRES